MFRLWSHHVLIPVLDVQSPWVHLNQPMQTMFAYGLGVVCCLLELYLYEFLQKMYFVLAGYDQPTMSLLE